MTDIRQQDRRLFARELTRPYRLIGLLLSYAILYSFRGFLGHDLVVLLGLAAVPAAVWLTSSHSASVQTRFYNKRYEAMWKGCQDRLARFNEVIGKMRRDQIADLYEMPKTIRRIGDNLYAALRRADMIAYEVHLTEEGVLSAPPSWQAPSEDPQAKELYRLADRNIAEYRQQFAGVMAGVHRAEAQSAVYMTTLDTLRMKMIGYRLVGKNPDMSSQDFLEALSEAKLQLHAIDQALDELDFTQMPKMVAVIPPAVPEHLQQGNP